MHGDEDARRQVLHRQRHEKGPLNYLLVQDFLLTCWPSSGSRSEKTPVGRSCVELGTLTSPFPPQSGNFSDYFSTAVNTGKGLSMLLIERSEGVSPFRSSRNPSDPGADVCTTPRQVETKIIKSSYSSAAGTAYITFDNVKVPVENLLGKEGQGLKVRAFFGLRGQMEAVLTRPRSAKIVLSNFNHEVHSSRNTSSTDSFTDGIVLSAGSCAVVRLRAHASSSRSASNGYVSKSPSPQ